MGPPEDYRSCPANLKAPPGVTASFGLSPALAWSPSWAADDYFLPHGPLCVRGDNGLKTVCITDCRGISTLRSGPPHPSPSLTLVSKGLLFSHFVTTLFSGYNCFNSIFPVKYAIPQVQSASLMALASRSIWELAGTGSVRHGGSFQQLVTDGPLEPHLPTPTPLPKPCHAKPYKAKQEKQAMKNVLRRTYVLV